MTPAAMAGFRRDAQGKAVLGNVGIQELLTHAAVQTPAYIYDLDAVRDRARELEAAFDGVAHLVAYAVKANTAGSILRTLAREGIGADVVSAAELGVALGAEIPADRIVMSGVAKTDAEIDRAIQAQIFAIQAESVEELARIAQRARAASKTARVALRVNPAVDIDSHAHIRTGHDAAKFGIAVADIGTAFGLIDAQPALRCVGLSTHVGSMLASPEPYTRAAARVAELARARLAQGRAQREGGLEYVNFGGGIGIDYGKAPCEPPASFVRAAVATLRDNGLSQLKLVMEPGRALVAPFGVLVARVVQQKLSGPHRWLMIDAGMNDLLRPALYGAHHRIEPVEFEPTEPTYRVVGPVCESSDDFGLHPIGAEVPALVVIRDAGAYGFVMASEYNGRAIPSEVFVSEGHVVSVSRSPGPDAWAARRLLA